MESDHPGLEGHQLHRDLQLKVVLVFLLHPRFLGSSFQYFPECSIADEHGHCFVARALSNHILELEERGWNHAHKILDRYA